MRWVDHPSLDQLSRDREKSGVWEESLVPLDNFDHDDLAMTITSFFVSLAPLGLDFGGLGIVC